MRAPIVFSAWRGEFCRRSAAQQMAPMHPLKGKRIVVTRAPEQSQELVRLLDQMGAEVILLPTVSFAPPEDWQRLDEQLRQLDFFDAILFLSKNAVRYICDRC